MKKQFTLKELRSSRISGKTIILAFLLFHISFRGYATAWTTGTTGNITTLTNWTNGSSNPTSFLTPGDTWTITLSMTIPSSSTWTLGTPASAPVYLTFAPGGDLSCGSGGAAPVVTVYGNLVGNGGTYNVSGGGAVPVINIYGNTNISNSTFTVNGGGANLTFNSHGSFLMTGGSISVFGGLANLRMNMFGNCSLRGTSTLVSSGGSATGSLHFCLPAASGTMMIDNLSTGAWSAMDVFVDTNCKAQLDSNFTTTTGTVANGLTVYGTLICPAADTVVGTHNFTLSNTGTLFSGHANGINGAIANTGTMTFDPHGNYGFNGSIPQLTGSHLPTTLLDPDTLIISNSSGVTLSQNTASTGVLSFISGLLYTGTYNIKLTGAANRVTGAGLSGYVAGNLEKTITGDTAVNYEVGDSSYVPMLLKLNAAGTGGSFTVKANNGIHPSIGTSGISSTHMVKHYWTVTNNSAAGPATVIPKATYQLSDILGGTNSYFGTQQYYSSAWYGSALPAANTIVPYTSAPTIAILLANSGGDYIFGRTTATLDVNEVAATNDLKIFPNPNTGTFTVNVSSGIDEPLTVVITNILGERINEITTTTNKATEIILEQPAGMYLLFASTAHGNYSAKVVVK